MERCVGIGEAAKALGVSVSTLRGQRQDGTGAHDGRPPPVLLYLNQDEDTAFEPDVAKDVLEIIALLSARLYGSRSPNNAKLIEGVCKAVEAAC